MISRPVAAADATKRRGRNDRPAATWPPRGALEDHELMAEDQEFDVTVPVLSGDERFQDDAENGVDDRQQHGILPSFSEPGMVSDLRPSRDWA